MGKVLVNGRVDEQVRRQAERVLAAHGTTPSQAIRGLYEHIAATRQLPDYLTAPDEAARRAERQRRLALLESVAGVSHAPAITTDEGTADVLAAEMLRRHG